MLSLTSNQTDFNPHSLTCAVLSCVWFFVAPWTAAHQVPLSVEFSRQQYWSWLPFPTPGDLPDPGIEPTSPVSPVLAGGFFTTEPSSVYNFLRKCGNSLTEPFSQLNSKFCYLDVVHESAAPALSESLLLMKILRSFLQIRNCSSTIFQMIDRKVWGAPT